MRTVQRMCLCRRVRWAACVLWAHSDLFTPRANILLFNFCLLDFSAYVCVCVVLCSADNIKMIRVNVSILSACWRWFTFHSMYIGIVFNNNNYLLWARVKHAPYLNIYLLVCVTAGAATATVFPLFMPVNACAKLSLFECVFNDMCSEFLYVLHACQPFNK